MDREYHAKYMAYKFRNRKPRTDGRTSWWPVDPTEAIAEGSFSDSALDALWLQQPPLRNHNKLWTFEEEMLLIDLCKHGKGYPRSELAIRLGRTTRAVVVRRRLILDRLGR